MSTMTTDRPRERPSEAATTATTATTWHTVLDTAVGPLTAVRDGVGIAGIYFPGHWTRPDELGWGPRRDDGFAPLALELEEYLAGTRRTFSLALSLRGTPFQRQVWALLLEIPYGEVTTYGALATQIGTQQAHPRAVGHAVGHNPVSILVPCHRVVGASRQLTGYAGGLERKQHLLALEGVLAPGATAVRTDSAPTLF